MSSPVENQEVAKPPDFVKNFHSGVAFMKQRNFPQASANFKACLAIIPDDYDAMNALADCYRLGHHYNIAHSTVTKAISIHPERTQSYIILGLIYQAKLEYGNGLKCFEKAKELTPDAAIIYFNIGYCQHQLALYQECIDSMMKCLELNPATPNAAFYLGLCYRNLRNFEASEMWLYKSVDMTAEQNIKGLPKLADELIKSLCYDPALKAAELLLATEDLQAEGYAIQAKINQQQGHFADAEFLLKRVVAARPANAQAYFDIVYGRKMNERDLPMIESMKLLAMQPALDIEGKRLINYALGKALDDLKDYKTAIRFYDEANGFALRQLGPNPFDKKRHSEYIDSLIKNFTPQLIQHQAYLGNPTEKPILIVGMIRSGTTLCEQILSTHPSIGAAGEVLYLMHRQLRTEESIDPEALKAEFAEYTEDYLKILESHAPDADRVTDKYPLNFTNLGAIHVAFPNAKIIHMRRNPLDNCLSMYLTPFGPRVTYCYDQDTIVFFYMEYMRVMRYWRKIIPRDRLLEVNYEDLVASPESEIRRMVEFLGVEWDDRLLEHNKNEKIIQTPSQWQARQPIYKSSMNKFEQYEPYLTGLLKLKDLVH